MFVIDFYSDMFNDWPFGTIGAIANIACFCIIAGLLLLVVVQSLIDIFFDKRDEEN